jgi:hypothetical protein
VIKMSENSPQETAEPTLAPSTSVVELETLQVLRGIHNLLQKIDGRLEDHRTRLENIEKQGSATP